MIQAICDLRDELIAKIDQRAEAQSMELRTQIEALQSEFKKANEIAEARSAAPGDGGWRAVGRSHRTGTGGDKDEERDHNAERQSRGFGSEVTAMQHLSGLSERGLGEWKTASPVHR